MSKQKVVLAHGREIDGKKYEPGKEIEVDTETAMQMIADGVARAQKAEPKPATPGEAK